MPPEKTPGRVEAIVEVSGAEGTFPHAGGVASTAQALRSLAAHVGDISQELRRLADIVEQLEPVVDASAQGALGPAAGRAPTLASLLNQVVLEMVASQLLTLAQSLKPAR